jgi:hypothetical protein
MIYKFTIIGNTDNVSHCRYKSSAVTAEMTVFNDYTGNSSIFPEQGGRSMALRSWRRRGLIWTKQLLRRLLFASQNEIIRLANGQPTNKKDFPSPTLPYQAKPATPSQSWEHIKTVHPGGNLHSLTQQR